MKKIMAMMIGLGLMLGTVSMFAAEEKPAEQKQEKKKGKKKKGDKKEEAPKAPAAR